MNALGLQLSDIEKILGFPNGWTAIAGVPQEELFRILQGYFDGVDFEGIKKIAEYTLEQDIVISMPCNLLGHKLARTLVDAIETRNQ